MSADSQNLTNHARWVPGYHFFTGSLAAVNFIWTVYNLLEERSMVALDLVVVAVVLLGLVWYARAFALAVQDRVIRLEERLRLARLLPADLQPHCDDFSANQLIALRFASDAELPELARKVLKEGIGGRKEIKQMVKQWRPDTMRA